MRISNENELWAQIGDSDYAVSTLGRVWSGRRSTILNGTVTADGYRRVGMSLGDTSRQYPVHRLVAVAFIPNPENLPLVRHWDDDGLNNVASNLRWGTHSNNRFDSVRNGSHHHAAKEFCKRGHEFTPENTYVRPGVTRRECRMCKVAYLREWQQRKSAA